MFLSQRYVWSLFHTELNERALGVAETYVHLMEMPGGQTPVDGGYDPMSRFLSGLSQSDTWVVDPGNHLLTSNRESFDTLPAAERQELIRSAISGQNDSAEKGSLWYGEPYLTVGVPIRASDGYIEGAVLIRARFQQDGGVPMPGAGILFSSLLFALVVGVIAAVVLSRHLTRPLEKMDDAAQRLAQGDYTVKTGVNRSDDIGRLAHTLDLLSGRLDQVDQERIRLNQMRQDFIVDVSHELRTPVTVLRGMLESMRDGVVNTAKEKELCIGEMLTEVIQLQRLINDLLELTRLQNADFTLEMSPVNLCDILNDSVRALRVAAAEREIPLVVENRIPAIWVMGDYGRLRQMLNIVIDNAVKYSLPGGPVRVGVAQEGELWTVRVSNPSHGIPPEELDHLFDRFRRYRDGRSTEGTGLGLSITWQIARRHNIELLAESGQDGEITFTFRFHSLEKTDHPQL